MSGKSSEKSDVTAKAAEALIGAAILSTAGPKAAKAAAKVVESIAKGDRGKS